MSESPAGIDEKINSLFDDYYLALEPCDIGAIV